MIFPIGDEPNPTLTPWVTYALLAANVAVFLVVTLPLSGAPPTLEDPGLQEYLLLLEELSPDAPSFRQAAQSVSRYDLFVFENGFRPSHPAWNTLLSSMFLHGSLWHLLGNMLFLWIYGNNVEERLGRLGFLLAYLGTGAAATFTHLALSWGSPIPTLGASGAISGILGFYFVWFPHNRVRLLVFLFPFLVNVFLVPARIVLGFYLVLDNLLPFLLVKTSSGVAYGAHIGGFLAGVAMAALLNRLRMASPAPGRKSTPSLPGDPIASIRELLASGRVREAAELYLDLWGSSWRTRVPPGATLEIARWLHGESEGELALRIYERFLSDFPRGPYRDRAHLGAGLILLQDQKRPAAAYQHLMEAHRSSTNEEIRAAAAMALAPFRRP